MTIGNNNNNHHHISQQPKQEQEQPQPQSQPQQLSSSLPITSIPMQQQSQHNDSTQHHRPPNAYTTASFISKLFFIWPYPLLQYGMKHTLNDSNLPENNHNDTSKYSLEYFHTLWKNEQIIALQNKRLPSLRYIIAKDYFSSLWYIQILMAFGATAKVVQAYTLGKLIDYFSGYNTTGYYYATILIICGCIILFEHHHLFFYTWKKGMQLRISCIAAIYDKCLKLPSIVLQSSSSASSSTTSSSSTSTSSSTLSTTTNKPSSNISSYGHVMNLVSNDVERFLLAALFINYIIWGPIQCIAILIVGYILMGYSFLIGIIILIVIFIPIQLYCSYMFVQYRNSIASHTDQRVTNVGHVIRGVRIMKMLGYETFFQKQIMYYRNNEIQQIIKANQLKGYNESFIFITNIIISLIIFIIHVTIFHKPLQQGDVFTVFSLINILQMELTKHVSLGIMGASELYVSLGRIQRFLETPEINTNDNNDDIDNNTTNVQNQQQSEENKYDDTVAIAFNHVTCYWNDNTSYKHPIRYNNINNNNKSSFIATATTTTPNNNTSDTDSAISTPTMDVTGNTTNSAIIALQDITMQCRMGEMIAIIGTVGCGKSALLQCIVQELPIKFGTIYRKPNMTIAYAGQDPWIMDGTIRENITLGQPYDIHWYNEVISACALTIDIQQFVYGDMTIVGDRGVQCSGGQRARIGLARAIYRRADILIVDDPLSAVDTKVGRQLYDNVLIKLNVQRGKCVIVATHQHQYVQDWTCILLHQGKIQCIGTYDECVQASNGKLSKSNSHHNLRSESVEDIDEIDPVTPSNDIENTNGIDNNNVETIPTTTTESAKEQSDATTTNIHNDNNNETSNTESFQEMNHVGTLASGTYTNYIRAMGGLYVGLGLLFLFTITQGSVLLTIVTVGRWSQRPTYEEQMDWTIIGYIMGLGSIVIVLAIFRAMVSFHCTIMASKNLHNKMTNAILRAKIQFFDTNLSGRILNRFSADIGIMDDQLPPTLFDFFTLAFVVIGAVATTITTLPFVLVVLPFLGWYFISVRRVFVTSTRELKRIEGLARSPIFAMIGESLNGIATIRSNNAIDYFRTKFQTIHDTHTRCFFAFIAASRWVGFRMDSLVFLLLAMASFLSVLFHQQGWFNVDPSVLGLSLSMLLQLAGLFQWCVRQSAEVVNQMVSVERVLGFGSIESEAPLVMDGDDELLASGWPNEGNIQLKDVSVRYRSTLPLALHDVNMNIQAGTRVGIVGRSGSGKSTFMQTLFRLLEVEKGQIMIDNVDISKIGLHTLRRKISVIPQVPTIFNNCTIRDNLDLLHQHTDDEIEQVIDDCHLREMVQELPYGYNTMVVDGSFSTGQRQLLCLARALLNKNKILILDEATANVDHHTDQLLQETLYNSNQSYNHNNNNTIEKDDDDNNNSENTKNNTMIAIAHRLDTVIDYDTIYVFGNGTILEHGTPYNLLVEESEQQESVNDNDNSDDNATSNNNNQQQQQYQYFKSMVNDTGRQMSQELYQRAKAAVAVNTANATKAMNATNRITTTTVHNTSSSRSKKVKEEGKDE